MDVVRSTPVWEGATTVLYSSTYIYARLKANLFAARSNLDTFQAKVYLLSRDILLIYHVPTPRQKLERDSYTYILCIYTKAFQLRTNGRITEYFIYLHTYVTRLTPHFPK